MISVKEVKTTAVSFVLPKLVSNGDRFLVKMREMNFVVLNEYSEVDVTFVAHNAKVYDNQLILRYFIEHNLRSQTIFHGNKILFIQFGEIRCLDSFAYFSTGLSALLKMGGELRLSVSPPCRGRGSY